MNTSLETGAEPQRARILFVDDEPRILIALKALFRRDYDVVTAASGEAALEILREGDVDVVVSDQRMPEMTGVEVLRKAKDLRPRAIRVLLTGYSDLSAILAAINEGEIFRFINKPWSNVDLRSTIAAAVKASTVDYVKAPEAPEEDLTERVHIPGVDDVGTLILDDDEATRSTLQRVLGRERSVYCASNLDEALNLLERHKMGVIVTEVSVGGEPVTELLTALRQHYPSLVAIVLTSQSDAEQGIDLINRGQIYRFLSKPISEGLLRGSVNLAMRRFEILQKHPAQTLRIAAEATPPPPPESDRRGVFQRIGRLFGLTA
ncbi:Hydrogenase transcriptional regulatory protein hupR1 [Zhongshania aliphaticivorans]|uniref:Hydrogenase transcriptional regulatory protein hupR1 n=1 Tax=Zhongshania aliphaticivorans TaxID=1470434 RepID=A0A5S9NC52_9GAMM|nr:response regulator [Zhongshania aliphaticivorans]CAA0087016.1 Hydrogenase transcriptional regulatory protein hupR1 [Zhongshania aliphaticivorans]CAA0113916.1 Hydrogenase transcriptional regulatory protein hupR1 [Zhongshania aliphaticivorans]